MSTPTRPNPRQTAGFLAAVAYNPPPEDHGYWFPASSVRQARRSVSRSPFAPYLRITLPAPTEPTPEGDETPGTGVYLSSAPGPHPAPLPDPAILPGYHRPLPDLLPTPVPLPPPASAKDAPRRGRPPAIDPANLAALPDHAPTPLTPAAAWYWRKRGFNLYTKNGVVYKGKRPTTADTADTPTEFRPCHVYLRADYRHRFAPPQLRPHIRYDIAGCDQYPYRYLALTAEQATDPTADPTLARFLRSFARRFTGSPTPPASIFADLYLEPTGAGQ